MRSLITNADLHAENKYFRHLISNGIFAMTAGEVHLYVSLPHTEEEINKLIATTEDFLKSLR